jgi:hypothetical protein
MLHLEYQTSGSKAWRKRAHWYQPHDTRSTWVSNKWVESLEKKGSSSHQCEKGAHTWVPTSWHKLYNLFGHVLGAKLVILYLTIFCHLLLYNFFLEKVVEIMCFSSVPLLLHVNFFWSYVNSMNFMNKLCTARFFFFFFWSFFMV